MFWQKENIANGGGCREGIATLKGPAWGELAGVSEGLGVRGG